MTKTITTIGFLLLILAFNADAHDSDRIDQLDKEIQEIEQRLSQLESANKKTGKAHEHLTSGEGWKSVTNWRKLTTDMGYNDVQKILGEPHSVDGGNIAHWYYENDGKVTFMGGKAFQWREPRP